MFWMELVHATIFLVALLGIPESPRYLVVRGETVRAEGVLARLYGRAIAAIKVQEIKDSVAGELHGPRFSDLIDKQKGGLRFIVWVGIGLAVLQQLVGINVVFYYGAVLWQAAGFTESDALAIRSEEHTSELQSRGHLVCR